MNKDSVGTVLVVDDENELRFILSAHLRAAGFDVLEASDGAPAVKIAAEQQPDLIIMDIAMPVMDGVSAVKAIKSDSRSEHIPIIMLTARSGADDVVLGLEAGAQEYLPKPFDVAELLARVRSVHRLTIARRNLDQLNTQLEEEVDHKTKSLQTLYEFMRDLNRAKSRDEICDLLIQCVDQTTGAQRVSLFLTDATGEYLECVRAVGMDRSTVERIAITDVDGITGQVFHSGKTLAARTYPATARVDDKYTRDSFVSTPLASTSLEARDGIIGVLNATEKVDDTPFTEDEIDCLRSVTGAAAIALDNVTRRTRLQQSVRVLLQTVGYLAEFRDEETTLHLDRVTKMARILAKEAQRQGPHAPLITDEFIDLLVQAAPMHDIGKVGIPDEILTKPGALTIEEFEVMKTHTEIGRSVLSRALNPASPVPLLEMCIDIAHCHHEHFDGVGYPRGLSGQGIPLSARMISLVDAYDAISSRRRYKEARSHEETIDIIRQDSGTHFDPTLVDAFLRCHHLFNEIRERYEEAPEPAGALVG